MKLCLLDLQPDPENRVRREFQGGYGLKLHIGHSWRAKFLMAVMKTSMTPVINMAYIAALAKTHGHSAIYRINDVDPDVDGVIINASLVAHHHELCVARTLREKGARVYFVGPLATGSPQVFTQAGFNVVVGEPEGAFARMLSANTLEDGVVESPPVEPLDALPFPDWDIFPYHAYTLQPKIRHAPAFPMNVSRGCAYQCSYCPYRVMTRSVRSRSVANVIDELVYLQTRYGMRAVFFRDPTFTYNQRITTDLCEAILTRNLHFEFMCETRVDCLTEDLLDLMIKAGLRGINIGVETPGMDTLKAHQRVPIEDNHFTRIIRHAEKNGVKINSFFILGYPEDDEDSLRRTLAYAKKLNTYSAVFFVYTPLPDTPDADRHGATLTKPWECMDGYSLAYSHDHLTDTQVSAWVEKCFTEYYFRPNYVAKYLWQRYIRTVH